MTLPERHFGRFARLAAAVVAVIAGIGLAAPGAAQTRFYVDAVNGSDENGGRSEDRAWRSLEKVNAAELRPGDTVLFRRGGTWNGGIVLRSSGRPGKPITFDAYGAGAKPILTRGRNGFDGGGQSHIVVRNFEIRTVTGGGIVSTGSNDWVIEHVTIDGSGLRHDGKNREFAGVQWWHGRGLTIANSVLRNVRGDGIWAWEVHDLRILGNRIEVCLGANSDNVHLYAPRNYEVRGNFFSMEGETESGKGNFHSQAGDGGLIVDNTFRGGNYGVGNTDSNLVVRANRFINHDKAKWSGAIVVSEVYDVINNSYVGNTIVGANMGIYIFQDRYMRENFTIRDNVFERIRRAAVVIESPISGEFSGNALRASPGAQILQTTGRLVRGQKWVERSNIVKAHEGAARTPSGHAR